MVALSSSHISRDGTPRITTKIRGLMLDTMDGDTRLAVIMHQFLHYVRCEEILLWCQKNKMRGPKLFALLKTEFNGSVMEMVKNILSRIDRDKKTKIEFGKDWRDL